MTRLKRVGSKVMKLWLRILGGAYIVVGGLDSFLFLFILGLSANELARKVVTNELKFQNEELGHWMYQLEK